jgi:glutamyl/glutaminyl-tRNA synthetase
MKSNGYPTYHLANVVDDHLMRVTHVLRGEEWLSSSAQHMHLYHAFGWDAPKFAHTPLLVNPDRSKLSKRQGDLHIAELQRAGVLPEALINFVAFLGWSSPGLQSEVFTGVDDIAASFTLDAVTRGPAAVDLRKLWYLNKQHQTTLTPQSPSLATVTDQLLPQMELRYGSDGCTETLTRDYLSRVLLSGAGTYEKMAATLDCEYFWKEPTWSDPDAVSAAAKHAAAGRFAYIPALCRALEAVPTDDFTSDRVKAALAVAATEAGCKPGALQPLLRYCLTGNNNSGPPMLKVMEVVGKRRSLARLRAAPTSADDKG